MAETAAKAAETAAENGGNGDNRGKKRRKRRKYRDLGHRLMAMPKITTQGYRGGKTPNENQRWRRASPGACCRSGRTRGACPG